MKDVPENIGRCAKCRRFSDELCSTKVGMLCEDCIDEVMDRIEELGIDETLVLEEEGD